MNNEILTAFDEITTGQTFAIGNDLVFMPDFKTSCTELFKSKVYTANEIAYCELFDDALLRYASTWAAKEAVYKAVKQLDATPLSWKRIEILRDKVAGKPSVLLHPGNNRFNISLTIAHDGDYVWAAAFGIVNPAHP